MGALIPRKSWHLHSHLHKLMKHTHRTEESFEMFKSLVRQHASILDKTKKKEEQDMEAWDAFLAQVLAVQPKLAMYQDFWPVQSYWESFARKTWTKIQSTVVEREDSPEIVFIKRTFPVIPQPMTHTANGNRFHPSSSKHDVSSIGQCNDTRVQIHGPSLEPQSCKTAAFCANSMFASVFASCSSVNDVHNEHETNIEVAAIAFCPLCEPPAHVDSGMNAELRRCLSHNESLVTSLADNGILFDQHLHFLCKLAKEDWESLLESVPPSEMSTEDKSQILDALRTATFCNATDECIPSPSAFIELEIINPALEGSPTSLQNAMRLQDHQDLFEDLWSVMKSGSVSFLQIAHPGIGDLANVICVILGKRPLFKKYDNFWPIRLYLLRMQSVANVRPTYRIEEEKLLFIEAFVQYSSDHTASRPPTTNVIQIPCRKHNPLDLSLVDKSVQVDLHARGLGELIPVMPYLAVINEDELVAFALYSDAEKDEVINLSGVKLTRFQEFILKKSFV